MHYYGMMKDLVPTNVLRIHLLECQNGKIDLLVLMQSALFLQQLLSGEDQRSKSFRKNIRSYNSMFAFTSTGGIIDKEINNRCGPYVFRMHG
jgi:hypothetical protein